MSKLSIYYILLKIINDLVTDISRAESYGTLALPALNEDYYQVLGRLRAHLAARRKWGHIRSDHGLRAPSTYQIIHEMRGENEPLDALVPYPKENIEKKKVCRGAPLRLGSTLYDTINMTHISCQQPEAKLMLLLSRFTS